MKCQILFSRKNKKKYFKMVSAEIFTQHVKCLVIPIFKTNMVIFLNTKTDLSKNVSP